MGGESGFGPGGEESEGLDMEAEGGGVGSGRVGTRAEGRARAAETEARPLSAWELHFAGSLEKQRWVRWKKTSEARKAWKEVLGSESVMMAGDEIPSRRRQMT